MNQERLMQVLLAPQVLPLPELPLVLQKPHLLPELLPRVS